MNLNNYHPIASKIVDSLKENNYWFETFEHKPVVTSQEAAETRPNYTLKQGAKALVLRLKWSKPKKKFVMLVLPGNKQFSWQKVKDHFEVKDVRFAREKEISEITSQVELGGIPPFGNLFGLDVIADPLLLENEKIVFNAGDTRFSVAMKTEDFVKLVEPEIVEIV